MWRQLTSMRTALFLLLLLAIGAVPGSIWPQRSIDPARTADYIADHPTAGAVARPARVLRGLRLAVVRGDLPAAVRLADRLRAAAHQGALAAMRVGPAAAPRPARAAGRPPRPTVDGEVDEVRRGGCGWSCAAGGYRLHAHDDDLGQRREGLPQGDRQPRLPPRPHLRHHRCGAGAPVRLEGRRHRAGRARPSPTPWPATTPSAPGPWVDPTACRRSRSRSTGSTRPSRSTSPDVASSASRATSPPTSPRRPGRARAAERDHPGQPPAGDWRGRASSCSATATRPVITVRDAKGDSDLQRRDARSSRRTTTTRPSGPSR